MTAQRSFPPSADDRPLDLDWRRDLVIRAVHNRSGTFWRIKDPLTLRYFELNEKEHFLLTHLSPSQSLRDLQDALRRQFAPNEVTLGELSRFLWELLENHLILRGDPSLASVAQRYALTNTPGPPLERGQGGWVWRSLLFHRFRGINPTPLLDRLVAVTARCPRWVRLAVFLGPPVVSLRMLVSNPRILEWNSVPGITALSPWAWLSVGVLLWLCRIAHELAHGVVCRWHGAECPDLGIQWMLLSPILYCDVSDAWLLASPAARIHTSAAGPLIDLWLASVSLGIALSTVVEPLRTIAWTVSLFCLVNTVLLNGNPLLKYDGYHVLCDVLDEPNLSDKARLWWLGCWTSLCLGLAPPRSNAGQVRNPTVVALYGLAAAVYRPWIWGTLLAGVALAMAQWDYPRLGWLLVLLLTTLLVFPWMSRLIRFLRDPEVRSHMNPVRVRWTVWLLLAFLAALMLVPLPRTISATARVDAPRAFPLYVVVPGQIESHLPAGTPVLAGEAVVRLSNPELSRESEKLRAEVGLLEFRLRSLETQRLDHPEKSSALATTKEALSSARRQSDQVQADLSRLELISPREGTFWPPPWRLGSPEPEDSLKVWSGSPGDRWNRGCWLEVGTLLGHIGDPSELSIVLEVPPERADVVRVGQMVRMVLVRAPDRSIQGTIAEVGLTMDENRLNSRAGGTASRGAGTVMARIRLSAESPRLQLRDVGTARISVDWSPCGKRVLDWIQFTFQPMAVRTGSTIR